MTKNQGVSLPHQATSIVDGVPNNLFLFLVVFFSVCYRNIENFPDTWTGWKLETTKPGRLFPAAMPGHRCDVCSLRVKTDTKAWRCKLCDFDLCRSCYDKKVEWPAKYSDVGGYRVVVSRSAVWYGVVWCVGWKYATSLDCGSFEAKIL